VTRINWTTLALFVLDAVLWAAVIGAFARGAGL
jgi:hypothetical protein